MSQAKPFLGFLGLEVPPRTESVARPRRSDVAMVDLSPEEWRIISLAECPAARRKMAELMAGWASGTEPGKCARD